TAVGQFRDGFPLAVLLPDPRPADPSPPDPPRDLRSSRSTHRPSLPPGRDGPRGNRRLRQAPCRSRRQVGPAIPRRRSGPAPPAPELAIHASPFATTWTGWTARKPPVTSSTISVSPAGRTRSSATTPWP